jgi:hypothetical protein
MKKINIITLSTIFILMLVGFSINQIKNIQLSTKSPSQTFQKQQNSKTNKQSNKNHHQQNQQKFENWQVYQNPKYDYQFKYDPTWTINDSISGSNQYDRIVIQGDISKNGWPSIEINMPHFEPQPVTVDEIYDTLQELFGPSKDITTTNFGKDNIYAAVMETPASSQQAYATKTYYFLHKG